MQSSQTIFSPQKQGLPSQCGIYCLGSDSILDWLIGLFESLRVHEPDRRVVVIPFDRNIRQLTKLQARYGFEFFESDSIPALEQMAQEVLGKSETASHVFRKFTVFWGPLEHFLFLDADIVLQSPLEDLFRGYLQSEQQFSYPDVNLDEAYKPGVLREEMISRHQAQGFNSGCFLSSHALLSLEQIQAAAESAREMKEQFVSRYEQSFFNYLVDTSGLRQGRFSELSSQFGSSVWAGHGPLQKQPDGFWLMNEGQTEYRMPMIHWAGYACLSTMPNAQNFLSYRMRYGSWIQRLSFLMRFTQKQRQAVFARNRPRAVLSRCLQHFRQ